VIFEFLIESLASFFGGYFSQKTAKESLTIKNFFFLIFLLLMVVSLVFQITTGGIRLKGLGFDIFMAISGATFCSFILWVRKKINERKKHKE
jgi:hypothetical protein